MKELVTILCVGIIGCAQAQTTSTDVEMFERYENGVLVEQRQSATENGVPIENHDFDGLKRENQLKFTEMDARMEEMKRKMDVKMEEMQQRMQNFNQRSDQQDLKMDKELDDFDCDCDDLSVPPSEEIDTAPQRDSAPKQDQGVGESTEDVKFT